MKTVMAGIDLHSNNAMVGLVDQDGGRLAHRKLECDLKEIVAFLEPYKGGLESVAVESTYNWYWLVDGLKAQGYPVVLANPAKIDQYSGIKHADDKNDAFFLAELSRLKILPTGYVYDPLLRPVRDLLRRRMSLVHQRTSLMLSFKSLYTRTTGRGMKLSQLKGMTVAEAKALYEHPANQLIAQVHKGHIEGLSQSIEKIEEVVLKASSQLPYDRKAAKTSTVIATKALACKLAKAAWYLMAEGSEYDERRVFPELAVKAQNGFGESGRQPAKGVGEKPLGLIGGDRTPAKC